MATTKSQSGMSIMTMIMAKVFRIVMTGSAMRMAGQCGGRENQWIQNPHLNPSRNPNLNLTRNPIRSPNRNHSRKMDVYNNW
jgi:hypothetical protein